MCSSIASMAAVATAVLLQLRPTDAFFTTGRALVNPVAHSWSQVALRWTDLPTLQSDEWLPNGGLLAHNSCIQRSQSYTISPISKRDSNNLEDYWPCAGELPAVNVIGTQLRGVVNSALTQWRMTVQGLPARHSAPADTSACMLGMKMDVGPGSYVALVTPMTLDGQVDEESLRGLIRWHVDSGTDGIVALGTTGEASVLTASERQLVLDIAAEETGGEIPLMAGTSSVSPLVVIEQIRQAAECGADAALVVTPAYVKPSQKGLVKFYEAVADGGALPVVLYNVPGRTAVDMGTAAVAELAKHPRIIGLKDATGDLSRTQPLREACPSDFLFYSGDDETGMEYMLAGGNGVVSVTANVAPREMSELAKACREGDRQAAEMINDKVIELHSKLFVQGNPVTVKYALARLGKICDMLRVPLVPMEDQYREVVDQALDSAGLLSMSRL